jgi:hypothetical protein
MCRTTLSTSRACGCIHCVLTHFDDWRLKIITPFRIYHLRASKAEDRVMWMDVLAQHARITPFEMQLRNLEFGGMCVCVCLATL